jgi:hypothetical protein
MRSILALPVLLVACDPPALPPVRFANAPPVKVVDDRQDVPAIPEVRIFRADVYFFQGSVSSFVTRALTLPRPQRARGVNSLDEVPDSTWFTNRIGVRELSPAEIERGSLTVDSPELHVPWTVLSTKTGGTSFGLVATDARGIKYLVKFDGKGSAPEVETGTHVIVNRLLWAAGYNVPEDQVVYLREADLQIAPGAVARDLTGHERGKLDGALLHQDLVRMVQIEPDGRIRAMASRWIDGTSLGGHRRKGTRKDDPNDRIPHELRRDLRGAYSIYAWLDHVDVDESNFVDSWQQDPANPSHHYVVHYAIDFGRSLGAMASLDHDLRRGYTYVLDLPNMTWQLVTLGLLRRPGDQRAAPPIRGVAETFEADTFEPDKWRPDNPGYLPLRTTDRFDKFWGAKIVARFSREQIEAAVRAARFTDPQAVAYITDTLVKRQDKTARHWYAQVNPLDRFAAESAGADARVCFDDLAVGRGYADPRATTYRIARWNAAGERLGSVPSVTATGARTCTGPITLDTQGDGYTIVELDTDRSDFGGTTFVHLARDPATGTPRVIGIWRM